MVHYEGGVEVELRSSFDGVGDRAQKSRGAFTRKTSRLCSDYLQKATYPASVGWSAIKQLPSFNT